MEDPTDPDIVIQRLLNEIRITNEVLTEAQRVLHCDDSTYGLTLRGGIAELIRQRDHAVAERDELAKELHTLIHREKY